MNASSRQPTEFEMAVYAAVRRIPAGRVMSYGQVAKEISRGNARSVGSALAKNPFAPEVPCHRVVRADGRLGGFYGETGGEKMQLKETMLSREGVDFSEPARVAAAAFWQSVE